MSFVPSKPVLYLLLGLVPGLPWLPQRLINLDAARPPQAFASGPDGHGAQPQRRAWPARCSTSSSCAPGLTRHAIVATKAATQVFAHLAKILVYGAPLVQGRGQDMPPWWMFAIAIPLSMAGTVVGGCILDRMSDVDFKRWTKWIVTSTGRSSIWSRPLNCCASSGPFFFGPGRGGMGG